jgi:hypothetical protein
VGTARLGDNHDRQQHAVRVTFCLLVVSRYCGDDHSVLPTQHSSRITSMAVHCRPGRRSRQSLGEHWPLE